MILTTHALAGAAIGKNFDSLWIIIPLSILLHFILDSLPHGEYIFSSKKLSANDIRRRIALDLFCALFFVFFFILIKHLDFFKVKDVLLGSFFSMFPDFLTLLSLKFKSKLLEKIHVFHHWVHFTSRTMLKNNYWTLANAKNDFFLSVVAIFFLFL